MRVSLVVASALALVVFATAPEARAFTSDDQIGNTSDGTPRFVDPDENIERMAEPSGSISGPLSVHNGFDPNGGFRSQQPLLDPIAPGAGQGATFNNYRRGHR